jgi:hypothetical protein
VVSMTSGTNLQSCSRAIALNLAVFEASFLSHCLLR